jgi:hypothetical protein
MHRTGTNPIVTEDVVFAEVMDIGRTQMAFAPRAILPYRSAPRFFLEPRDLRAKMKSPTLES